MWRCSLAVNQNGFNSRITSEALEERFRQVFPAQAGAELIQDLYASGVIVPTIDFTSIAEGSFLPEPLQQAWDFSTGSSQVINATTTEITTPGFWLVDLTCAVDIAAGTSGLRARVFISDGVSSKNIWAVSRYVTATTDGALGLEGKFVVFLRAGDQLKVESTGTEVIVDIWYRQIASVNGTLVNPLGFTF
jgi:hypothetical protein